MTDFDSIWRTQDEIMTVVLLGTYQLPLAQPTCVGTCTVGGNTYDLSKQRYQFLKLP